MDRETRDQLTHKALSLAKEAVKPYAKEEFYRLVETKTKRRRRPNLNAKGPFAWKRITRFLKRFSESIENPNHVYAFWNGDQCVYVGQTKHGTLSGGGKWKVDVWRDGTRFQVFTAKNRRDLSKIECLAIDIWHPYINLRRAPKRYHRPECPIHRLTRYLNAELFKMFSLRG